MKPVKGKKSQTTTCNKEYKIVTNPSFSDHYWDEGIYFYKRRGKWTNMQRCQVRWYRTWKHNRKTQWKE